jgi:uncharacterized protein YrrD
MIDYDGAHVIDGSGENIGTVEQTYVGGDGAVQFVEVKIGTLLPKHRMVPADAADLQDDGLHVSYDKQVILSSPDVAKVDHVLDGDALGTVRDYYAGAPMTASEDRSEDDAVEEDASQAEPVRTAS